MDAQIQALPIDPSAASGLTPELLQEMQRGSQGGDGQTMEAACKLALEANFGSWQGWRDAYAACAKAQGGGSGWMLLVFLPYGGSLVNRWLSDPTCPLGGGVPLLALDLHELVDGADSGLAATAGVDAFLRCIDWAKVYVRYREAVHAASEPWGAAQDEVGEALVLDVRRAAVFEQARVVLPGSRWCDPSAVATWAGEVPAASEVIVYCVHGHEVSRATALRLRAAGLNARYLRGGIDTWQAAGLPLADKSGRA